MWRGLVRGGQWCGAFGDLFPAERLAIEQPLLGALRSLRLEFGARTTTRKVDKLSCVRFGSARYSVPCRPIGHTVTITTTQKMIMIIEPVTGEVLAEHQLVAPGESSILDDHYGEPATGPALPRTSRENPNREGFPGPR
jgi:Mu transposase-like protein